MTMSAQVLTEEMLSEGIAVVVKHTFIDVSLPSMAQDSLRRSSVPAGMWLCPLGTDQRETCAVSDASTYTGCAWESQGEEEDEEDTEIASQEVAADSSFKLDTCSESCGEKTYWSSSDAKPTALRTALRSTAKMWQPLQAWQSQRFDKQMADIKAKVEVAMLCSGYDADIHVQKESNGYTVSVTLATEDLERFGDEILAEAQQTLLTASEQSTCVCVLGYRHQPFQALQKGFIATLAEMQDEASACWDTYSWGVCPYGCACTRQHPRSVAYIVVQLIA